jgi:hypothetical protein
MERIAWSWAVGLGARGDEEKDLRSHIFDSVGGIRMEVRGDLSEGEQGSGVRKGHLGEGCRGNLRS